MLLQCDPSATTAYHACEPSNYTCTNIIIRDIKRNCLQSKLYCSFRKITEPRFIHLLFVVATKRHKCSIRTCVLSPTIFLTQNSLSFPSPNPKMFHLLQNKHVRKVLVTCRCVRTTTLNSDGSYKSSGDDI